MRKEIRRIAAILVAGCLLTGVLCASFAEDTGTPFVSESNTVTIEAAAGELPAVTTETDGTADPAVTEEAAESGDPEEIPEQPDLPADFSEQKQKKPGNVTIATILILLVAATAVTPETIARTTSMPSAAFLNQTDDFAAGTSGSCVLLCVDMTSGASRTMLVTLLLL